MEKQLIYKMSVFATNEDLTKEISSLKVRLTRNMYIVGVVQFLAIVASVLMLLKFHVG